MMIKARLTTKLCMLVLAAGLGACSSSQQDEEKLENDANGNNEETNNEGGNAEGGNAEGGDQDNNNNEGNQAGNEAGAEAAAADEQPVAPEEAPPPAPDAVAAEPAPPAPADGGTPAPAAPADGGTPAPATAQAAPAASDPAVWDPARVVRWVLTDNTPILEKNEMGSTAKGMLNQGDHVMVLVQGEWVKISDTMWLPMSTVSATVQPRSRTKKPTDG